MTSAFHTFKLVPMASTNNRQPTPIVPPSTPANGAGRPSPSLQTANLPHEAQSSTPTSESRMNPPPIPRSLITPVREMRESSVASSASNSARKPRQNLDERDHILMVKHCLEQRGGFKEGTKAQFWTGVNTAFQKDTGKVLAQMSATVGRLVEARRRQISDWENEIIPQKPDGELNDLLDQWMEFLKSEDGDAEAERMRQVDARRKIEEARKEARRQAIAAEAVAVMTTSEIQPSYAPPPPPPASLAPQQQAPAPPMSQPPPSQMVLTNGQSDMNGYPSNKRKRGNDHVVPRDLQDQMVHEQAWHDHQYAIVHPPEPPRRIIVEGAMTKEDWRDVMGNDARLRALESKVDKIELLVSQNNLLLQLIANQNKERDRHVEEERVPVHLDADFERDYL